MLSATASLGLIHMWDVDGGLIPTDKPVSESVLLNQCLNVQWNATRFFLKFTHRMISCLDGLNAVLIIAYCSAYCCRLLRYLYSNEDYVKSGALLAIGLVNCGIRNECDPALALLSEYVYSNKQTLRIGAVLGLGIAYAGSRRKDVTQILSAALADEQSNIVMQNQT